MHKSILSDSSVYVASFSDICKEFRLPLPPVSFSGIYSFLFCLLMSSQYILNIVITIMSLWVLLIYGDSFLATCALMN